MESYTTTNRTRVYLIREVGSSFVKVGVASDPSRRLSDLQTGNPRRLEIVWTIPGGYDLERALHSWFDKYRAEGEWFEDFDGHIRDFFASRVGAEKPALPGSPPPIRLALTQPRYDTYFQEQCRFWGDRRPQLTPSRLSQMYRIPRSAAEHFLSNYDDYRFKYSGGNDEQQRYN